MSSQPICILDSHDRELKLKVNNVNNEYNQLKYFYNDEEENTQTVLIDKNIIELDKLNIGKYTLYTCDYRNNKESDRIDIYIQGNTYQDRLDKLWKLANIEDNSYNNSLKRTLLKSLRHNPENSLLYLLCIAFLLIEDIEDFERELFFKLILIQEKYENLELSNYNRYSGFNVFKNGAIPKVLIESPANTIKVYKVFSPNEKRLEKIYKNVGEEIEIYFDEGWLYEIQLLNNTDLVTVFRHYQFDYDRTLVLWNNINEFLEEYNDITEDMLSISANSKLNSYEVKNYLIERNMFPRNNVIPRIKVTYPHNSRSVSLNISNISYMNTSDHTFYLSGKDIDFLDENINNQFFKIGGDYDSYTIDFNPISNMIDKEALLYIVDENGTILSKATRALFTDDDYENYTNYYEKIRQLEISDYNDNLIKYVSNSCPQYYEIIQETSYNMLEDEEVNIDNLLEKMINSIDNNYNTIDKNKLFYEILKNHFINTNYDSQFFTDKGFTWEPYTFKLITEESQTGYVLKILAKEQGEEEFSKYYIHSFKDRAIELKLNRYGKYIIYAISEEDYRYSGFFYLNVNDNFYKSYLLNQGVR